MNRTITIGCGYDEPTYFHLRAISLAEERAFLAKYAEFADADEEAKVKGHAKIHLEAISEWANAMPSLDKEGKKPVKVKAETPKEAILELFKDVSDDNDRLVNHLLY